MTRILTNRILLRAVWLPWILLPYPLRKRVTSAGIWAVLKWKRAAGTDRQLAPTPNEKLFTLSFWGVPRLVPENFHLTIGGKVESPLALSLGDLMEYPLVERQVALDCVGGLRNIITARGVSLAALFD